MSKVLVLVAGLNIVLAQLYEGTRKVTSIKGQQGTSDEQRKSQRGTTDWCSWLCATVFLFFPIFAPVVVFLVIFLFLKYFFLYFSLDQQNITRNHTKFQNFLCEDLASGKFAKSLKSVQKLQSSDRQSSQGNFAKIESANPAKLGKIGCKIFCRYPWNKKIPDSESVCESYSCFKGGTPNQGSVEGYCSEYVAYLIWRGKRFGCGSVKMDAAEMKQKD